MNEQYHTPSYESTEITFDDLPGERCINALAIYQDLKERDGFASYRVGLEWLDQALNDLIAMGKAEIVKVFEEHNSVLLGVKR